MDSVFFFRNRKTLLDRFIWLFRQKAAAAAGELKQESFYIDGQHNTKLSVLKTDSTRASTGKKSVRKYSPGHVLLIPTNEDNEPSHVREHSLIWEIQHQ